MPGVFFYPVNSSLSNRTRFVLPIPVWRTALHRTKAALVQREVAQPEGLCGEIVRNMGDFRRNRPAVTIPQSLRDSSLYTREPWCLPYCKQFDKFQFIGLFEICTDHLPLPLGEVPPKGAERAVGTGKQIHSS